MISIVIPTFNSEKIIKKLCDEISNHLLVDNEIIIVNDASTDNTKKVLGELSNNSKNISVVNLKSNIGQVGATILGISLAKGNYIVTMDDDLQHHPKNINDLYEFIKISDSDIVVAKWRQDETILRNIGSYGFSILSSLLIIKSINFRNTAFRIFKSQIKYDFVEFFKSRYWIDPRRLNLKVSQINVIHNYQNFRPYSSFKSRITLALKHVMFDSFFLQFLILIVFQENFYSLLFVISLTTILQNIIRENTKRKRSNIIY